MMLLMSWLSSAQDIVRITQDHKDRAAQLMSGMTLEQKCHVISGLSGGAPGNHSAYMLEGCPELGVPSIVMGDGPQGINSKTNRDQRCTYSACGV